MATSGSSDGLTQSQVRLRERLDRGSILASGVPEDYADAILDSDYMDRLVQATDRLHGKRKRARDRYIQLNRCILVALIVQAVVTTYIAGFKTLLMPDFDFSMDVALEDVDMVMMLDASGHLGHLRQDQHRAVMSVTDTMAEALEDLRYKSRVEASRMMQVARIAKSNWFDFDRADYTLRNPKDPGKPFDKDVRILGGKLRVATGVFNGLGVDLLHSLALDPQEIQRRVLGSTDRVSYRAHSKWYQAMEMCSQVFAESRLREAAFFDGYPSRAQRCTVGSHRSGANCAAAHRKDSCDVSACMWDDSTESCMPKPPLCRRQYCVIVGDSDAECGKNKSTALWQQTTAELCSRNTGLCPDEHLRMKLGSPLEWSQEMRKCKDTAQDMLQKVTSDSQWAELSDAQKLETFNSKDDISMIMMFLTPTEAERQARLRSTAFRDFVKDTTGCNILARAKTALNPMTLKNTTFTEYYMHEESCARFVMETSMDEIARKAENIKSILYSDVTGGSSPNPDKDWRYAIFFIGPINLLVFLGSGLIIRWCSSVKLRIRRAVGVKRKMIKVTKHLVEKVPVGNEMLPEFKELELAEIQRHKLPIEFGRKLTLRARLKGGFLRCNAGRLDCEGRELEQAATLYFEAAGAADTTVQVGQQFRIRNLEGEYLCIDDNGARFLDEARAEAMAPPGLEMAFCADVGPEAKGEGLYLAQVVRIKSARTGQYLRVTKDGVCDCVGRSNAVEAQFVIDIGGLPLSSGSIVTLRNGVAGKLMHGHPAGGLYFDPPDKGDAYDARHWSAWVIEKVESRCRRDTQSTAGSFAPSASENSSVTSDVGLKMNAAGVLQEGDVVTLRALSQNFLEVDGAGSVFCGLSRRRSSSGDASGEAAGERTMEFVLHRMGISSATKRTGKIRCGGAICLRPVSEDLEAPPRKYLRWVPDRSGMLVADGNILDREISFTINQVQIQSVIEPMSARLQSGDADIKYARVCDKRTTLHHEALSAAWTDEESLSKIRGPVVVIGQGGAFSVPKACDAWVALVQDGVDLFKAVARAKERGATGLIVRCEEACSLDRLRLGAGDEQAPCLPVAFINEAGSEALMERGLVLLGCDIRRKTVTALMRALGGLGNATTSQSRAEAIALVFDATGAAMREQLKDDSEYQEAEQRRLAAEEERLRVSVMKPVAASSGFKWQITSNTTCFWAGGGASAARPSRMSVGKDAAGSFQAGEAYREKRTSLSVIHVTAEDVKAMRLADDLDEVLAAEDEVEQAMEELSKDSDFKIEYTFEEVEVPVGESPGERDAAEPADGGAEEEFLGFRGKVVKAVGVPKSKFWIVALLLMVSSAAMVAKLHAVMTAPRARDFVLPEDSAYRIDLPLQHGSMSIDGALVLRPMSEAVPRGGDNVHTALA